MTNTTRRLMGDPPAGRTPWAAASVPTKVKIVQSVGPAAQGLEDTLPERAARALAEATGGHLEPGNTGARPELGSDALLRAIRPLDVAHIGVIPPATGEPIFERVDPRSLLVDEAYQRDLSPKSVALIEKIAAGWDWRRFKPPVVAFADGGLQIIDGQHTAIAAASRSDITAIPVMVVEAPAIEERAKAFIGHNQDRLAVSAMQIHHAAVAAGDAEAVAIEAACSAAGVSLVRSPYGAYKWRAGESIAIAAIRKLVTVRGPELSQQLLKILVDAELAPVRAEHIKAVEMLFTEADYRDNLEPLPVGGADVATAVNIAGDQALKDAKIFASAQEVPLWKALGIVWFRKSRKRRKTA